LAADKRRPCAASRVREEPTYSLELRRGHLPPPSAGERAAAPPCADVSLHRRTSFYSSILFCSSIPHYSSLRIDVSLQLIHVSLPASKQGKVSYPTATFCIMCKFVPRQGLRWTVALFAKLV
jgi:hypothetical protein